MWFVNLCNSKFRGTKPHPFNILKNFHHENLNELVIFFILWIFNMPLSTYVQFFLKNNPFNYDLYSLYYF